MAKAIGAIILTLALIFIFIIVGAMIVNQANEQSDSISGGAVDVTKGIGNAFIFAGVIGLLLLILSIVIIIGKKTRAF